MSRAVSTSNPNAMTKFIVEEWSDVIHTPEPICDSMEEFLVATYKGVADFSMKRCAAVDKDGKPGVPHTFKNPKPPRSHIDGRRINLLEKATVTTKRASNPVFRYNVVGAAVEWPATNATITERLKTLDKNFNPKSPGTIKTADITQLLLVSDIFNKAVFMCLPSATYLPKDKQRTEDSDHSWGELFILTPFEVLQVVGSLHVRYLHGDQLTDAQLKKKFVECMETLFATIKKHKASEEHFLTPPPHLQIAEDIYMPVCETEVYIYWKHDALKQPRAIHHIPAPKSASAKRSSSSSASSSVKKRPVRASKFSGDNDKKEELQGEDDESPPSAKRTRTARGSSKNLDEVCPLPEENFNIKKLKPRPQEVSDDEDDGKPVCSSSSSSSKKTTTPKKPATPKIKAPSSSSKEGEEDVIGDMELGLTRAAACAKTMEATFSSPEIMRSILLKHFSSADVLKKVHEGTKKQVKEAENRSYKVIDGNSHATTLKGMLADYVPDETMELPATFWSTLAYCAQDQKPELKAKLEALLKTMETPTRDLTISLLTPMDRRHRSTHEPSILAAMMVQGVKLSGELIDAMGLVEQTVAGPLLTELKCLESVTENARVLIGRMKGEIEDLKNHIEKAERSEADALKAAEALKVESKAARESAEEAQRENEKLKAAIEAFKKENLSLQDQLTSARTEIQEMKSLIPEGPIDAF